MECLEVSNSSAADRPLAVTARASLADEASPASRLESGDWTSAPSSLSSIQEAWRHGVQHGATTILLETCDDAAEVDQSERAQLPPSPAQRRRPRAYYLDWMRIVSIYLVVCYHVVQALDWIGLWCGWQQKQDISFRCVALQIGMPLFFHISGRAQAMAKPVNFRQTIARRSVRLLVPFLICYVVLIPPWIWVSARDEMESCVPDSSGHGYRIIVTPNSTPSNMFVYLWCYWTGPCFKLDPGWLWFLPILFFVTVFSTPLFLYAEYRATKYLAASLLWLLTQLLLSWKVLGYSWTFGAYLALGPIVAALTVNKVPLPAMVGEDPPPSQLARYCAIRIVSAAHIIGTLGAVMGFRYADISSEADDPMRAIPQMFMYPLFYTQGFFAQRWWPEHRASKAVEAMIIDRESDRGASENGELSGVRLCLKMYQLIMLLCLLLVIFTGSPIGEWEFAAWPVYSRSFHDGEDMFPIGYVLSTWAWIALATALFQAYANEMFNARVHKHASNSTIIVYIFHWAFLKPFVFFIVRDLGMTNGLWKYFVPAVAFLFSAGSSLGVYILLLRYPAAGRLFGV